MSRLLESEESHGYSPRGTKDTRVQTLGRDATALPWLLPQLVIYPRGLSSSQTNLDYIPVRTPCPMILSCLNKFHSVAKNGPPMARHKRGPELSAPRWMPARPREAFYLRDVKELWDSCQNTSFKVHMSAVSETSWVLVEAVSAGDGRRLTSQAFVFKLENISSRSPQHLLGTMLL